MNTNSFRLAGWSAILSAIATLIGAVTLVIFFSVGRSVRKNQRCFQYRHRADGDPDPFRSVSNPSRFRADGQPHRVLTRRGCHADRSDASSFACHHRHSLRRHCHLRVWRLRRITLDLWLARRFKRSNSPHPRMDRHCRRSRLCAGYFWLHSRRTV